jgi:tight adherence protein B
MFANRDAVKVRDRLAGRQANAAATAKTQAQPLFAAEGGERQALLPRILSWLNVDTALQSLIDQAGVTWTSGQVLLSMLVAALAAFNVCWYFAPPEIREVGFPIAAGAAALPIVYLKRRKTKRIHAFEAQFPDALQFIARAMRAGHAFSVSLEMLHKEFAEPLAGEFRRAFEEQNLGLPIDTALEKLSRRMPMLDVQFFVAAVILQKRTGGNLAEILDKLSTLIRERFKLRGQIRSISAHGRLSSAVLTGIPIVVGVLMYFVNREHMQFFVEEEIGRLMAGVACGFVVLGYLIMRQIVKIEV